MFKFDFSRQAELYFKKLREFIDFFVELKHDIFLQEFLLTFRSIGNYLNNGSRSAVKAFRIESIEKCYTLIGQDKETSLFDFICKTIYKDDPNLFDICKTYRLKNVVSLAVLV